MTCFKLETVGAISTPEDLYIGGTLVKEYYIGNGLLISTDVNDAESVEYLEDLRQISVDGVVVWKAL